MLLLSCVGIMFAHGMLGCGFAFKLPALEIVGPVVS